MVLTDPRQTIASMRPLHVCVTCARELRARGYVDHKEDGKAPTIALGEECEAHPLPARVRPQATAVIMAPEACSTMPVHVGTAATERPALEADELAETGENPTDELGVPGEILRAIAPRHVRERVDEMHVRQIATQLLVAWSTHERTADDTMIDEAVRVARALVARTTKGT